MNKSDLSLTIPSPEPDPNPLGSGSSNLKTLGGISCASIAVPPHKPAPECHQAAGSQIGGCLDWRFAGAFAGFNLK